VLVAATIAISMVCFIVVAYLLYKNGKANRIDAILPFILVLPGVYLHPELSIYIAIMVIFYTVLIVLVFTVYKDAQKGFLDK